MPKARHSKETRDAVLALGTSGMSYPEIQETYPIPKSTLSFWFKMLARSQIALGSLSI
jgi:hypothetical protein